MKIKDLFKRKKKEENVNPNEKETEKQEENNVIYETESFRVRKGTKEEIKELKKREDEDIKMKYKDLELNMCGFVKVTDKKTDKLVFAYKIKPQERVILIHIPKNLTKEEQEKVDGFVGDLKPISKQLGYEIMNSQDFIAKIYNEKHILEKVGEEIDNERNKENKDKEKKK